MSGFTIDDTYLSRNSQQLKYKNDKKIHYQSIAWGQRKLLISDLTFLTLFWNPNQVVDPICLCAGAAPGTHWFSIIKMFPMFEFHFYDPNPFEDFLLKMPQVKIHREYFTNQVAEQYKQNYPGRVFFISDIRRTDSRKIATELFLEQGFKPEDIKDGKLILEANQDLKDQIARESLIEAENKIVEDMNMQQEWVKLMDPVHASLKFRLTKIEKLDLESIDERTFNYLGGVLFWQPWVGQHSHELRLVPMRNAEGQYYQIEYYIREMADIVYYHNTIRNDINRYSNIFEGKMGPYIRDELLNDFDSSFEVMILKTYFDKFLPDQLINPELIVNASIKFTENINIHSRIVFDQGRKKNKTLSGIKQSQDYYFQKELAQNGTAFDRGYKPRYFDGKLKQMLMSLTSDPHAWFVPNILPDPAESSPGFSVSPDQNPEPNIRLRRIKLSSVKNKIGTESTKKLYSELIKIEKEAVKNPFKPIETEINQLPNLNTLYQLFDQNTIFKYLDVSNREWSWPIYIQKICPNADGFGLGNGKRKIDNFVSIYRKKFNDNIKSLNDYQFDLIFLHQDSLKTENEFSKDLLEDLVLALKLLKAGGHLVVKLYHTNLRFTKELILFVATCFDTINIIKPITLIGKEAEKFLIAKYKKSNIDDFVNNLERLYLNLNKDYGPKTIFDDVLAEQNYRSFGRWIDMINDMGLQQQINWLKIKPYQLSEYRLADYSLIWKIEVDEKGKQQSVEKERESERKTVPEIRLG